MLTSNYQDSFQFKAERPSIVTPKDKEKALYCYNNKYCYHHIVAREEGTGHFLYVSWFEPKRLRTGMERVHCVIMYGREYEATTTYVYEYSGGTGHSKHHASFYSCLYKLGLDLYKDDKHQTGHFAPSNVLPALIKHLFRTTNLSDWDIQEL